MFNSLKYIPTSTIAGSFPGTLEPNVHVSTFSGNSLLWQTEGNNSSPGTPKVKGGDTYEGKKNVLHEAIFWCSQNATNHLFALYHNTAIAIAGMRGLART